MLDDTTTHPARSQINPDGLTYRRKPSGSPFNAGAGLQGQTMSCFLCGKHRPRPSLRTRFLVGRHQAVCAPSRKATGAVDAVDVAEGGGTAGAGR